MFRKFTLFLMITFIVLSSQNALAHSRTWPGKQLGEALPEATNFTQKQANLTVAQVEWLEKNLGETIRTEDRAPLFYVGVNKENVIVGSVFFLDATGVNGKIEMGLAVDSAGQVLRVVLYEHAEGASVGTKEFLKQFVGKKAAHKFTVGSDVIAIKGHEKSAQIVATAVRRGLLLAKIVLPSGDQ